MWMIWPKSFQLVSLLKLPQFLLDEVEEVSALKATAAAVQTHDYGVEGADQHRGPVHLKLLRHHLTTGGAVPNSTSNPSEPAMLEDIWSNKSLRTRPIHYNKTKLLFCFYMISNKPTGWMLWWNIWVTFHKLCTKKLLIYCTVTWLFALFLTISIFTKQNDAKNHAGLT